MGTTKNTVTTGTLKLLYTENIGVGNGISMTNALPVSDEVGKSYGTENYVFDFKIEATNTASYAIPYEVTLRKKSDSTLNENNVKIYLTDMTGDADTEIVAPTLYSDLVQTQVDVGAEVEKTLYKGTVNSGELNYEKSFRLRMWISEDASYNYIEGKTFTALVNVYSNIPSVESTTTRLLIDEIMENNIIEAEPTLTDSINNTTDASGLYKSTDTNDGRPTYYFRGNVENNYVSFAGQTWRVVRVNEDGTVRIVMQDGAINEYGNQGHHLISDNYDGYDSNSYLYMYYSNNRAKTILEEWYTRNIEATGYSSYLETGDYYCEQAKVKPGPDFTSGSATMKLYSSYTPDFRCSTDGNGKGIVNSNIGLLTYDEVVYAGGYVEQANDSYYLYDVDYDFWTMSPAGHGYDSFVWALFSSYMLDNELGNSVHIRPVLILKADTAVTGIGTVDSPWIVQ